MGKVNTQKMTELINSVNAAMNQVISSVSLMVEEIDSASKECTCGGKCQEHAHENTPTCCSEDIKKDNLTVALENQYEVLTAILSQLEDMTSLLNDLRDDTTVIIDHTTPAQLQEAHIGQIKSFPMELPYPFNDIECIDSIVHHYAKKEVKKVIGSWAKTGKLEDLLKEVLKEADPGEVGVDVSAMTDDPKKVTNTKKSSAKPK